MPSPLLGGISPPYGRPKGKKIEALDFEKVKGPLLEIIYFSR